MKKNLILLLGLLVIVLSGCGNTGGANAAVEADPFAAGNVYEMYYVGEEDPSYQIEFLENQRVGIDELRNRDVIKFDYSLKEDDRSKVEILIFDDPYLINLGVFSKENPYYYTVKDSTIYLVAKNAYFGNEDVDESKLKELEDSDVLIREAHQIMKLKE